MLASAPDPGKVNSVGQTRKPIRERHFDSVVKRFTTVMAFEEVSDSVSIQIVLYRSVKRDS